jgi:exopolyphosphatase/guanosine-5'-triphosphate,3'-diphosphate pyrophosphatase
VLRAPPMAARAHDRRAPSRAGGHFDPTPTGASNPTAERPVRGRAPTPPLVAAAVDAGATSVHLLVAVVREHQLEPLVDESVFLGLGRIVDERGFLGEDVGRELTVALASYANRARQLGATRICFVGTEPLRRAADSARVIHDVWRESRVALHVIEHEEEALLTLLGATAGRPPEGQLVLVDVGGGSSEFVVDAPKRKPVAAGIPVGSVRLTSRFVANDPPNQAEIGALNREARRAIAMAPEARPRQVIVVGGTASNLLRVVPDAMLDRTLTRGRVRHALRTLSGETAEEASIRHAVRLERARILPAGAAIVGAIMDRYGVNRVQVSDAGIREGAILAVAHAGIAWRDSLARLAQGWLR